MKPRTIRYYFKAAFQSLIMNRLMSVASIFTVASCILIVSVFFIVSRNVAFLVRQLEDTVGLVVFIDEYLPDTGIPLLEGFINNIPQVSNTEFISREVALENFRNWLGEGLTAGMELRNPLRHSFAIELHDLAYQNEVVSHLWGLEPYGVANVREDQDTVQILVTLSMAVQVVSGILIFMLGMVSIVIITNTIRITVNARRTEINIMKYVGATDWFIRWPFVIEGMLIGLIGGAIPILICWFGYERIVDRISAIPELSFLEILPPDAILFNLIPFALFLGVFIGLLGSLVSVRRHLKV